MGTCGFVLHFKRYANVVEEIEVTPLPFCKVVEMSPSKRTPGSCCWAAQTLASDLKHQNVCTLSVFTAVRAQRHGGSVP